MSKLVRDMSTPENRAYWHHIEHTSKVTRADATMHICCVGPCKFSDSNETCKAVMRSARKHLKKRRVTVYV